MVLALELNRGPLATPAQMKKSLDSSSHYTPGMHDYNAYNRTTPHTTTVMTAIVQGQVGRDRRFDISKRLIDS